VFFARPFWQSEIVIEDDFPPLNSRSILLSRNHSGKRAATLAGGKLAVLRHQDFRRFYVGYATSLLGSAMTLELERDEHAGFIEQHRTVHQEREGQQRLAGSGPAADERRPAPRQSAARDLVEAVDAGERFRELRMGSQLN